MKKRGNIQKLILFFWFLLYLGGNIYYTQDVFASNNNISNSVTNKTSKVDDFKKAYEDGFYNTNDDWSVTGNFNFAYVPTDIKAYNKATTNVSDVKISVEFKEKENNKGIAYLTDNKKRHSDNKATDNLFIGKLDTNKTPTLGIFTQAGKDEGKLNTSERWNFDGSKFVGTLTITFDKEVENPILDLSGIGGYRKVFGTETDESKKYAKGSFSASELELKNADITVEKVGTGANLQVENKKIKVIDKNTYSQSVLDKPFVQDAENPAARTPNLSPAGTGSVMLVGKMKEVTFDVYHSAIPFSKFSKEQYHTGESYFTKEGDKKCADRINGLNTLITEEVCKDKFNAKGTKLYNSDLFLISIRLAKRGSVDVKYITTDGKILENVTDVVKDELVGKDYITVQKSFNGYVFEKMDTNSAPTTGKVKEEKQHVIYVYREHIPGFPPPPSTPSTKVKFSKKALTENGEELKGATIRLTKEDGSLVKEWVTDGTVKEFELKDGKYTFTEISAPAKYQVATAITFEVKNGKVIVKGIEVTGNTIVMVDKLKELPPPPPSTPSTKVKFSKKALTENGEELKGATIRLTKEDGSLVKEWVTDGTVKEFELKDGKYTFTEISAPAKYQVATAITFEVKNGKVFVTGTEVTGNTIVMVDKLRELPPPPPSTPSTKVKFSKKALTENGEELKGATIRLTKEDGSLVKEWVTDGTVKEFELKDGKYTFTEISAPDKYQVATAITFEVKNGKVIVKGIEVTGNTIVMVDKLKELPPPPPSTPSTKVKFSKKALTENGEELKGATIRLTKEDGSLVKEWVTDGTVKEFELKDGKYTFTEISAPAKYQVATAITFEVKNGKVFVTGTEVTGNTIVMVDKLRELPPPPPSTPSTKVKFSKKALTENGEELKGATIRLTKEDGSLVKEWVTDGTVKEFELKDGKYTFTEISAPDKYQVATAITFEVKNGKVIVKGIEVTGNTIVMVDKLKELPPPPPSTPSTKVKFSKKALTENGEELKGATIRLTKEDGSLVKEWVTDGTVKEFELKDGKYTFTEISAPDKYQVATAITFEVKNGKVIVKGIEVTGNTIVMVDKLKELPPPPPSTPSTKVKFSKKALTENGEELKGATIRLTKEDGSLVKEWVTDGTVKEFELKDGKYTFTEISAPDKYQVATAITFEVKNGKVIVKGIEVTGNTIVMVDKLKELPSPNTNTNKTLPKTGEGTNISLYAWLMLTSGTLLVLIGYRRRNHAK